MLVNSLVAAAVLARTATAGAGFDMTDVAPCLSADDSKPAACAVTAECWAAMVRSIMTGDGTASALYRPSPAGLAEIAAGSTAAANAMDAPLGAGRCTGVSALTGAAGATVFAFGDVALIAG